MMRPSKQVVQRVAIAFLILAAVDMFAGQKPLAMVCAGLAIALSLGAGAISRGKSTSGKGR